MTFGGSALSLCAWAKWSAFGLGSRIASFGNEPSTADRIIFHHFGTSDRLGWSVYHNNGEYRNVYTGSVLKRDIWTHVCGTVDTLGSMQIFVNGVEEPCIDGKACEKDTGKGGNGWVPNRMLRKNAYIGRSNEEGKDYFQGSISDITIIDGKALNAAEVAEEMLARAPLTWTFQLDSFDDGDSIAVTSTGANTGQLTATVHQGAQLGAGSLFAAKIRVNLADEC